VEALLLQFLDYAVKPSKVMTYGNAQRLLDDLYVIGFSVSPHYLCRLMALRGYAAMQNKKGQLAFYCKPRYRLTHNVPHTFDDTVSDIYRDRSNVSFDRKPGEYRAT